MRHATALLVFCLAACASNPYGYAPEYAPLGDEEDFIEHAQDPSYEDVRRNPAEFDGTMIGWFAVVQKVEKGATAGQYRVSMDLRFHQERHLCTDQFDDSCRVTISERAGGPFTALMSLRSEDQAGKYRLGPESLVKVYGKATHDFDAKGGPILRVDYYRHWPVGNYATTGHRGAMKR